MRNFKKYFFESLIQLTILANVFRQNNQFTSLIGDPFFSDQFNSNRYFTYLSTPVNQTSGDLDLLLLNENLNLHLVSNSSSSQQQNEQEFMNSNSRVKEAQSYFDESRAIERLDRLTRPDSPLRIRQPANIVLQPASAIYLSNNHKGIIDLSEMRILLNSLELNAQNDHTFRKVSQIIIYVAWSVA